MGLDLTSVFCKLQSSCFCVSCTLPVTVFSNKANCKLLRPQTPKFWPPWRLWAFIALLLNRKFHRKQMPICNCSVVYLTHFLLLCHLAAAAEQGVHLEGEGAGGLPGMEAPDLAPDRWTATFQVALKFQSFEIENHDNCVYDYLEIRDGGRFISFTPKHLIDIFGFSWEIFVQGRIPLLI